ncbi:MAG: hypothetical protein QME45_08435 [Clostridiales bacterium]|nr:hypothetical protein [Clostridiales bacterium]HBM81158.1 hypothetical protein [Clostridiaceae bacterium]
MELTRLMIKYYINTVKRSFKLTVINWKVSFVLIIYSALMGVTYALASRLYFVGGILVALVSAACISSYLYLIEEIINSRVVSIYDFKNSFTPYLGRVINVTFYIWIASLVYNLLILRIIQNISGGFVINLIVYIAVIVLLNPIFEFIYQSYVTELNIFSACVSFMKDNFIEWMIPNAILILLIYYLFGGLSFITWPRNVPGILKYIAGLFVLLFTMIYRGILFRFLNESTRRSRLFKLRMLE